MKRRGEGHVHREFATECVGASRLQLVEWSGAEERGAAALFTSRCDTSTSSPHRSAPERSLWLCGVGAVEEDLEAGENSRN